MAAAGTVYWVGNDGNVYGKGSSFDGVQNLGKAGNVVNQARQVTHANGVTTLLPLSAFIANPGNPDNSSSNSSGSGSGSGSGSSSSSYVNPAAVALYKQLASSYQNEANTLEGQIPTLTKNIENAYNTAVSEEDQQNTNLTNSNNSQRQTTIGGINQSTNSNYQALMSLLGHAGAAVSSAATVNAPQAVSQVASGQTQAENTTYNENKSSIDESYQNALHDLLSQKNSNLANALSGVKQQEQSDIQAAEAALTNAAQYGGMSTADAQKSVAPLLSKANDVQAQLNQIFGQYGTPEYEAATPPSLTQYAQPTPAQVNTQAQNPNTSSAFLPYLANLQQENILTGSNTTPAPATTAKAGA